MTMNCRMYLFICILVISRHILNSCSIAIKSPFKGLSSSEHYGCMGKVPDLPVTAERMFAREFCKLILQICVLFCPVLIVYLITCVL